jgi:E3 ubiquitin-protein ligase DOA10
MVDQDLLVKMADQVEVAAQHHHTVVQAVALYIQDPHLLVQQDKDMMAVRELQVVVLVVMADLAVAVELEKQVKQDQLEAVVEQEPMYTARYFNLLVLVYCLVDYIT